MKHKSFVIVIMLAAIIAAVVLSGCPNGGTGSDNSINNNPSAAITYTITFNANGGSGTMSDITAQSDKDVQLPACTFTAPVGKQFAGWNAGAKTGDMILWAEWTPITYTIKYDSNGGSGTMPSMSCVYDEPATLAECAFTAPADMRFASWNAAADGTGRTYMSNETVMNLTAVSDAQITLYAQWIDKNAHIIEYRDLKGADNSANPTSFKDSQKIELQNITAVGYTFLGWHEVIDDIISDTVTTGWNAGDRTGDVTLTAKWSYQTSLNDDFESGTLTANGWVVSSKAPEIISASEYSDYVYDGDYAVKFDVKSSGKRSLSITVTLSEPSVLKFLCKTDLSAETAR